MTQKLFTIKQVAEILNMNKKTVYNYCLSKRINAINLSETERSLWRIPESELNRFCDIDAGQERADKSRSMVGKKQPRS